MDSQNNTVADIRTLLIALEFCDRGLPIKIFAMQS